MIEEGGGLALVNPGKRRPHESWEETANAVVAKYLGARSRDPKANPAEPAHESALLRSNWFSHFTEQEFSSSIVRNVSSILGVLYSCLARPNRCSTTVRLRSRATSNARCYSLVPPACSANGLRPR